MYELPNRVCIIGAGSSGIAACKVLKDHGILFDCYEAGDRVGGNWVYENVNKMSSAYKSLFINTSRPRMQYSDYPMPEHYPVFPHHTQIAEYFNDYVEHFGVKQSIRAGHGVWQFRYGHCGGNLTGLGYDLPRGASRFSCHSQIHYGQAA